MYKDQKITKKVGQLIKAVIGSAPVSDRIESNIVTNSMTSGMTLPRLSDVSDFGKLIAALAQVLEYSKEDA